MSILPFNFIPDENKPLILIKKGEYSVIATRIKNIYSVPSGDGISGHFVDISQFDGWTYLKLKKD